MRFQLMERKRRKSRSPTIPSTASFLLISLSPYILCREVISHPLSTLLDRSLASSLPTYLLPFLSSPLSSFLLSFPPARSLSPSLLLSLSPLAISRPPSPWLSLVLPLSFTFFLFPSNTFTLFKCLRSLSLCLPGLDESQIVRIANHA